MARRVTFNSNDLEHGNVFKGLSPGLGDGSGDWRLELIADDQHLDVRAYVRNVMQGGGLTHIHQLATPYDIVPGRQRPLHSVSMLNPAWNTTAISFVRIFNRKNHYVRVQMDVPLAGSAWCDIPPYSALVKTSAELIDLAGEAWIYETFQDSPLTNKWSLTVHVLAAEPSEPRRGLLHCESGSLGVGVLSIEELPPGNVDDIGVMALVLDTRTGNLANLSGPPAAIIGLARAPRISEGDFDISLEFGDGFSEEWQAAIRHAADRWEQIIVADYPDSHADLAECGVPGLVGSRKVDDLLIRVEWEIIDFASSIGGRAYPCGRVSTTGFPGGRPNAGVIYLLNSIFTRERVTDFLEVDRVVLHEIGHVLGIGTLWSSSGFLKLDVDRPEFTGPRATAEYERVSPKSAASARRLGVQGVPVEDDGIHWRASDYEDDGHEHAYTVLGDLMRPGGNRSQNNLITAVTMGALDDLGYEVDYAQADCQAPSPDYFEAVLCDETLEVTRGR